MKLMMKFKVYAMRQVDSTVGICYETGGYWPVQWVYAMRHDLWSRVQDIIYVCSKLNIISNHRESQYCDDEWLFIKADVSMTM